jgi:Tol biopolymer transport system component
MSCYKLPFRIVLCAMLLIAVSATSHLFAAEPRRLTTDGHLKMDPVFISGGEELVYTVLETPFQTSLMRLKVASGKSSRLFPEAATTEFEPAFSRDERYCAFVQNRGNLSLKLVIRDTKAGNDVVFDPGGGFSGMHHPSISPDARYVIFAIPAEGGQQITRVTIAGQNRKELTQGEAINNWPSYSPDGGRIVFSSSRDDDFEIYTMDTEGGDVRRLTKRPGRDMRACWSPDGRRIAFTSAHDGNDEIYVMHADGSNLRRVTTNPERDDYSAWHPDGHRLVFMSERSGSFDFYLAEVPE